MMIRAEKKEEVKIMFKNNKFLMRKFQKNYKHRLIKIAMMIMIKMII